MIETVWLLAAIELNGALISRGAMVSLTDTQCAVEHAVIAPSLSDSAQKQRQGDHWITKAEDCSYSESDALLKIRLSQESLAHKTLTLSESSGTLSIALLHDPSILAQTPEYASQPAPTPIPSAAFDVFAGSGFQGLGGTFALGPWSLQGLRQSPRSGPASERFTAEHFMADGAHARVGDFRTSFGFEQAFGEFRGLSLTNRAAPLRGDGKAQASLAIENPSRVQFFDRNGIAVYSSEILPPGNYQVQGYGASTIPGFLEARLVDVNGVTQSVALPWSADRRLMSQHQTEWEMFSGYARDYFGGLSQTASTSAQIRYGITQQITTGLHTEHHANQTRWAIETSTRAIPSLIGTVGLGSACHDQGCDTTWLVEARSDLRKKAFLIASVGRNIARTPTANAAQVAQLSLSGSWSSRLSGAIHLASEQPDNGPSQHSQTLSASLRLAPQISLQLQARHQLFANEGSAWIGTLGVTVSFAALNASAAGYVQHKSKKGAQGARPEIIVQAAKNSPSAYGPQISLAHAQGQTDRSDAFGRYASQFGDASARIDSVSNRLDWSASTRLWVTPQAITFAPTGEHNLVIHQLGLADVKIHHAGTESQKTDARGKALFRKSPAWTDSRYLIDSKTVPFGVSLGIGSLKIPLASHRAYLVDYRKLWSTTHHWQIANAQTLGDPETIQLTDRHGKTIFLAADGYVDLHSSDQLPITLKPQWGQQLQCQATGMQQSLTVLDCHSTTL